MAGARRGLSVAAATILLAPIIRVGMIQGFGIYEGVGRIFPTVADGLATGCVLAGTRGWLEQNRRYLALLRSRFFPLLPLAALGLNAALYGRPTLMSAFGATGLNVLIAVSMHRWVLFPSEGFARLLNTRAMEAIGVLSYSLYLWQQLLLNRSSNAWPNVFPVNVLLTFAVAWASYRLVEKPLIRLRQRFQANRGAEPTIGHARGAPSYRP